MTKSELREMLRAIIKEELKLHEAAFSGGYAEGGNTIDNGVRPNASTQPGKENYLTRMKRKNPDLVSTMIIKGKDIKPGMITQSGQVKEAEIGKWGRKGIYLMHTNDYDGFWGEDEDMEVMADPDNKSKPFTGDYRDLLKKGLKESAEEPVEKLAVVFLGNDRNREAVLSKITEPRHEIVYSARDFIRQYSNMEFDGIEKGNVKLYADAEGMQELKDVLSEVPARLADPILKATTLTEDVSGRAMDWEELLAEANHLLEELCIKSGNAGWDGAEGELKEDVWCYRKLFSTRLNDTASLDKLCNEYSKKLSGVQFYFCDNEDEEVSEIGFSAVRRGWLTRKLMNNLNKYLK